MVANVRAVQMTYIMISSIFFTTRASHPYTHRTRSNIQNYSNRPLFKVRSVWYKKNVTHVKVVLLLGRDLHGEWGTPCSLQRYFCNSWWVRCCFWILYTTVYSASLSNCGCHNTEAVKMQTMEKLLSNTCLPRIRLKELNNSIIISDSPVSECSRWHGSGHCCWCHCTHRTLSWSKH